VLERNGPRECAGRFVRRETEPAAAVRRIFRAMVLIRLLLAAATVASIASCESRNSEAVDYGSVVAFDSTRLRIATGRDTVSLFVEVARTSAQKTQGLMERQSLPDSMGMLFVYEETQPADAGFWMYRTRIPLDIAFADSLGVIVSVLQMEPCTARLAAGCPTYAPGSEYRYALEVNAGFFARNGVEVGSRIVAGL
jgi:uncharacterized membrane protein (UPF0127 family)